MWEYLNISVAYEHFYALKKCSYEQKCWNEKFGKTKIIFLKRPFFSSKLDHWKSDMRRLIVTWRTWRSKKRKTAIWVIKLRWNAKAKYPSIWYRSKMALKDKFLLICSFHLHKYPVLSFSMYVGVHIVKIPFVLCRILGFLSIIRNADTHWKSWDFMFSMEKK